jgi:hypothetical protein
MVIQTLVYLILTTLSGAAIYMAHMPINRKPKNREEDSSKQQAANKDGVA